MASTDKPDSGSPKVDVLTRYERLRNHGVTTAAAARMANEGAPPYARLPDLHRWPTVALRAEARRQGIENYRALERGGLIDALARCLLPSHIDMREAPPSSLLP